MDKTDVDRTTVTKRTSHWVSCLWLVHGIPCWLKVGASVWSHARNVVLVEDWLPNCSTGYQGLSLLCCLRTPASSCIACQWQPPPHCTDVGLPSPNWTACYRWLRADRWSTDRATLPPLCWLNVLVLAGANASVFATGIIAYIGTWMPLGRRCQSKKLHPARKKLEPSKTCQTSQRHHKSSQNKMCRKLTWDSKDFFKTSRDSS